MSHRHVSMLAATVLVLFAAPVASAQSPSPTPSDLTPVATASPDPSPSTLGPIGGDPPLREPVVASGPRERLHTSRSPDAWRKRDGVTLEMWLPQRILKSGEWLTAHIRITNERARPISLHCYPTSSRAQVHELFDPGREWTGNAATFKRAVLEFTWLGSPQLGNGRAACPKGKTGMLRLRPGEQLEYDASVLPRYAVRDQPLPSGTIPVTTTLEWETQPGLRDHTLTVRGEVRLEGPPWPWASPQQIVDAALEDPDFGAWLAERSPGCCSDVSFEVVDAPGGIYWRQHGYTGPAPDGTVVISTFPSSVLLDPWTAQVLGFFPGYHRLVR